MSSSTGSRSARLRQKLGHPVIDSDGHMIEVLPVMFDYLKQVGDVLDTLAVLHATGARRQPKGANKVLTGLRGHQLDPSLGDPERTSKIVVDATRALPAEGGPAIWQAENRALLVARAPESFARVDERWEKLVGGWNPPEA